MSVATSSGVSTCWVQWVTPPIQIFLSALIARIGDEVVVKRFYRKDVGTIELQSESHDPQHKPIRIIGQTVDFGIVGTVVGAIVGTRREEAQ